jgi:cardiolipin synthase
LEESGNLIARVILDGPDADYDKLRWTLLAALAEARTSVQILTPYFLPDRPLVEALIFLPRGQKAHGQRRK